MKNKGDAVTLKKENVESFEPPAGSKEALLFDINTNLVLRAYRSTKKDASGKNVIKRQWLHRHNVSGKRRFANLGDYPEMPPTAAREASKKWQPPDELAIALAPVGTPTAATGDITFGGVIEAFLQKKLKPSTTKTYTDIYNAYIKDNKTLCTRLASEISPQDAWSLINTALTKRPIRSVTHGAVIRYEQQLHPTPAVAAKLNALCSAAYEAAIFKITPFVNPFLLIRKYCEYETGITNRPEPDTRPLEVDEIPKIWCNLNKNRGHGTPTTARALMFMLVTGQRPGEVLQMHRSQILPPEKNGDVWWRIPDEVIKTNKITDRSNWRPHFVYLTQLALRIIGDCEDYIFAGGSDTGLTTTDSLTNLINKPRGTGVGGKEQFVGANLEWSANDLRRTVQNTLEKTHKPRCHPDLTAAILNHEIRSKVHKAYAKETRAEYEKKRGFFPAEKKKWLINWSNWLENTIGREHTEKIRHADIERFDANKIDLLTKLVWQMPQTEIAKELKCSDRTIGVLCVKHDIPRPRKGHRFPKVSTTAF